MRVWRLCRSVYAATAFSGDGAWRYAGRWNPAGVRMVYTSTSLALAAMEMFVHLDPSEAPADLVVTSALLPEGLAAERMRMEDLPKDWRAMDHPGLRTIGATWVASLRSVALEVPSVAVEGEWNVLLNPAHPEFPRIVVDAPVSWRFDERMYQARQEVLSLGGASQ